MKNIKNKFIYLLFILALIFVFTGCSKDVEVKFNTNGGTEIATASVKENTEYELPTPTKDSYEFLGWYLSEDFSGDSVTKVNVGSGITVYAKWAQLATITLDLNGGDAERTTIQGRVGETIKSLVKDITPTKSGLKFGSWYVNNNELTDTAKLTDKGVTLKANWLVQYTVNIYKQNLEQTDYELTTETFYAQVGKKVSADYSYEGFTETEKTETVTEITLDSDKTKNVMNIYFDRETYTITFRSNYSNEELAEETKTVTLVYGQTVTLPEVDFACEGYYLLGWSENVDGTVLYNAHYIDNLPINGEKVEVPTVEITASRNMSLYAIWNKGYTDMFGGNDYIFLVEDNNEIIYLCRGDKYFVGEYYQDDKSFIFYNTKENLEGKVFDDHTFAYYNVSRDEYSATLYEVGTGLVDDVMILFDAYNGITYSEKVEEGKTEESTGTYIIDENGYYVATFTDGKLKDKVLTIVIGTVTLNDVKTDAFQVRNEDEVNLGKLVRFVINNNQITYYTSAYDITLTGFGTLSYNTGSSTSTYYYTYDDETKTLNITSSSGTSAGVAKIMTINNVNGYMFYTESLDQEYSGENDSKLTLDGVCNATYTNNGTTVSGYYTLKSSAFGGYIVTFASNGTNYTFLTSTTTEEKVTGTGEEETTETITYYNFEVKPEGYAEYYYRDTEGTYYAPLVVINDKQTGKASVYGYTTGKTYELVLEGAYSYDENTKLYTFTTESVNTPEVLTTPVDISKITALVMSLDTTATKYAINYWYSSTIDDVTTAYGVDYTSTDGATLKLIAGIAIFSKDGYVVTGSYSTKSGLTTITTTSSTYVYLEIDEENKTFITLEHSPYSAYVVLSDGTYSKKEYITLDGKGNGTYTYYVTESVLKEGTEDEYEDQEVAKTFTGTITKLDETTRQGIQVYQFTSETRTFKYLLLTSSSAAYIFTYNSDVNGEYTSNDGILYLDGYSYYASFTDKDGNEYSGIYAIESENVIKIVIDGAYRFFDLNNSSFTVRGKEYGTYIEFDNQGAPGNYIELDGYGKATIFKYTKNAEDEYERTDIDTNATYTINGDKYTIVYKEDAVNEKTMIGYLSTYTYSSTTYKTFVIEHQEVVKTFINSKDWSILKLDAIGNAVKYDNKGVKVEGSFIIISDSLLYFVTSDSSDANIYKYNMTDGTIIESEFTARGYYTSDLKSLLFSQYGFAIFNNDTRYYYCMNGNDVIIYHQDASNPNANQYGFIEENFGEFLDVKEYKGETYYSNDGYAVTFNRKEDTKDNYPVLIKADPETYGNLEELVFTPSGSDTFSVTGAVKINGTQYSCTVVRELVEEEYVMYVKIGSYRFDITATYGKSEGKTVANYEVIGLSYEASYYPYTYLNTYYYIYSFLGSTYASRYTNNIGMITIHKDFDINGQQTNDYINLEFLEGSNAYDLNNTLLSADELSYTTEGNYYKVPVQGTDGYTYNVYFGLKAHSAFNMYAYYVAAITRAETLTYNEYTLNIERIIATDSSYSAGTIFKIALTENETALTYSEVYNYEDNTYYVVRTYDEETKKLTSTTYYKLTLVLKDAGSVDEGEESEEGTEEETTEITVVKQYESMTVTKSTATTYFDSAEEQFIDVVDGKVTLIGVGGYKYIVYASEYDVETNTYTVTLSSGVKYTIKLTDNVGTFTKVEEEASNEEA